jgi:hypothetical protein
MSLLASTIKPVNLSA